VRSAAIDAPGSFAYIGTATGQVVQVRLSDFTRIAALALPGSQNAVVLDAGAGYLYFGANDDRAIVHRVRLSDFSFSSTLVLVDLSEYGVGVGSAVIDLAGGFAYFGTTFYAGTGSVFVYQVRLVDFTVNDVAYPGQGELLSAVIDPAAGLAYFGNKSFRESSNASISATAPTYASPLAPRRTRPSPAPSRYTFTAYNIGPNTSTGVVLSDTLPAGVTYRASSPGCVQCRLVTCALAISALPRNQVTVSVAVDTGASGW
jgi:hypothetical protein